jgi:hypothetical protein
MSPKIVTNVVWYILVQLSSLNNTLSMLSGVSVQLSGAMKMYGQPATSYFRPELKSKAVE